jgi:predicted ATPase
LPPAGRVGFAATAGRLLWGEIADQIFDRTDGVPLLIEELCPIDIVELSGVF